jgi:gamma-glutamyltranspeptidase
MNIQAIFIISISGIAQTLLNNLTFGMTLEKSVSSPRIHSQLYNPDAKVVEVEGNKTCQVFKGLNNYT